jgi:hypothetical protein
MTVRISDTDRGAKRLAKLLADGALSVGVLGGDASAGHEDSDLTVGEIAEIHEFGLGSAPRRSFLAGWVDEKKDEITSVIVKGSRALARGKVASMPVLLEQIGAWAVGSIQERISNGIEPPNAPETIKRKGSSVPLIDKGQLRASISYRVDQDKIPGGS